MELMSSLLLCVLVAVLPQTFGNPDTQVTEISTDIRCNNSELIQQKPAVRKPLLLNINAMPLVNNVTQIKSVFTEAACAKCLICMNGAIKEHAVYKQHNIHQTEAKELKEYILSNDINYRSKRKTNEQEGTKTDKKSTRKPKPKKNKSPKSVTVTKYNLDGEVYALKVKESSTQIVPEKQNASGDANTCQVYSVKKYFPCDSPESNMLLTVAKRKANKKKEKKEQERTKLTSTTPKVIAAAFRKREVDNSQVLDTFMPSIEELY